MSYLVLASGVPDFATAVFSFWFRTEQEMIDIVRASGGAAPLRNKIPLLVFGNMFAGYSTGQLSNNKATFKESYIGWNGAGIGFYPLPNPPVINPYTTSFNYGKLPNTDTALDPSYIGIDCGDDDIPPTLRVRLQGGSYGSGKWVQSTATQSKNDAVRCYAVNTTPPVGSEGPTETAWNGNTCSTATVFPSGAQHNKNGRKDETAAWVQGRGPDAIEIIHTIEITPDQWHHILLSFDVSPEMAAEGSSVTMTGQCEKRPDGTQNFTRIVTGKAKVTSACNVWLALDDKNYAGVDLNGGIVNGLGPNELVSVNTMTAAGASTLAVNNKRWSGGLGNLVEFDEGNAGGIPIYKSTIGLLPSSGAEFGIPCTSNLVNRIAHCEMAELQIFFGATLDTGEEANRRAFIDFVRDSNGNRIPTEDGQYTMKPVDMRKAAELMSKTPEIILHGVANWKEGKNTGSMGIAEDGEVISEGQFAPTGEIKKYKPDPALETAG